MNSAKSPIPSATILMLRENKEALETFMVIRHHQIDFASGALVFPGGKVDQADYGLENLCNGLGNHDDGIHPAYRIAAVREAFEESGILFARDSSSLEIVSGDRLAELSHYREKLHSGEISFRSFLEREGLILTCSELIHFAHWITPEMMPKRFDTHFFLAKAPNQNAIHDGGESIDSVWISPEKALAGNRNGKYTIIFPTRVNLELLGENHSIMEAMESSRTRNIITILPWTEQKEDGAYVMIKRNSGYKTTQEKIPYQRD